MSNHKEYFYICEDCDEAIKSRLDTIKNFINPRCRHCDNVHKGIENRDKISETITSQWIAVPKEERKRISYERFLKPEALKKRVEKVKQGYAEGRLHAWNEGLHERTNTGRTHFKKGIRYSPETEFKPLDKHIQWKGGIGLWRGTCWTKIRTKILKRDKCCQFCGNTDNLEIHHIIPYRFDNDNSERNLITLCKICHNKFERMFDITDYKQMYFARINEWRYKTNTW